MLRKARVLAIEKVAYNCYRLLLQEPHIAGESAPGQFVHIRISESLVPFLRRPFSIAGTSPRRGTVQIFFRVVGEGTRILSKVQKDEYLDCLGPLGTAFSPRQGLSPSVLIAGGIGVAPLLFTAQKLVEEKKKIAVYYGTPSFTELIPLRKFLPAEANLYIATEDGSAGERGRVTEVFEAALHHGLQPAEIFACGPRLMLRDLAEKNKKWGYPLQLSLEERMACGLGACQGCAVKLRRDGETCFGRVCREGPVFNAYEVEW